MTRAEVQALAKALAPILAKMRGQDGLVGKDGLPGRDGRDGVPGKDGRDVTLKEAGLFVKILSDRSFCWCFPDGTPVEVQQLDGTRSKSGEIFQRQIVDAGNWQRGKAYAAGDGVTWDGHWWLAQKDTTAEPVDGGSEWRIAARRGKQGAQGKEGKEGRPGKDLTQLGTDGKKW